MNYAKFSILIPKEIKTAPKSPTTVFTSVIQRRKKQALYSFVKEHRNLFKELSPHPHKRGQRDDQLTEKHSKQTSSRLICKKKAYENWPLWSSK